MKQIMALGLGPNAESFKCHAGRYVQRVEGTTLVRTAGESPCGVAIVDGMLSMRWHVEIVASKLDRFGFVLDNNAVKAHVESHRVIEISCEQLAQKLAQDFGSMLEAECGKGACESVKVTIWGGPHASLEYCWP